MKKWYLYRVVLMMGAILALTACSNTEKNSVEEEVAQALFDEKIPDVKDDSEQSEEGNLDKKNGNATGSTSNNSTANDSSSNDRDEKASNVKPKYGKNPFLGDTSTATSYDIKFTIETDSGVAGFTWGSMDGTKGEYYLVAFDCTREFPKLYTCRKNGEDTYDEAYTNIDFMYPEMVMFTGSSHIVEIKVDETKATVFLDSYTVSEYTLDHAVSVGQIGTWVMEGDYHETIDNLFIAEGVNGDGDWIYSEDFADQTCIFSPELQMKSGKLYAKSGYYTVPTTALMQ